VTTVDVRNSAGEKTGTVELPADVFDVTVNVPLIHQVVVAQLAAARQGSHNTKARGEVRGGGRKPYRQKGTGRARQGSNRAPQYAGGGVVHGPTPRDYGQRTPKKMKAAALRAALSDRARNGRLHVVEGFGLDDDPSTRAAVAALGTIVEQRRNVLVVVTRDDETSWKSLRNVQRVHVLTADQLNTYDVLVSDDIVFTSGALEVFLRGAPKGKAAKAVARESELADVEAPAAADADVESDADAEAEQPKKAAPKKTAPKKTTAKKAAVKKTTTATKTAAEKATAKKATAKKTTTAKTTTAKKTTAKRAEGGEDA
jgi:large subunit ribosomal protein L4